LAHQQRIFARARLNVLVPGFDRMTFAQAKVFDVKALCGKT
jgi:hypothetical protein